MKKAEKPSLLEAITLSIIIPSAILCGLYIGKNSIKYSTEIIGYVAEKALNYSD